MNKKNLCDETKDFSKLILGLIQVIQNFAEKWEIILFWLESCKWKGKSRKTWACSFWQPHCHKFRNNVTFFQMIFCLFLQFTYPHNFKRVEYFLFKIFTIFFEAIFWCSIVAKCIWSFYFKPKSWDTKNLFHWKTMLIQLYRSATQKFSSCAYHLGASSARKLAIFTFLFIS